MEKNIPDYNQPADPQYPDHVIIAVEDEDWRVFIEVSSGSPMTILKAGSSNYDNGRHRHGK